MPQWGILRGGSLAESARGVCRMQREGIAERDPSGDIDGHDAAIKVGRAPACPADADVRRC